MKDEKNGCLLGTLITFGTIGFCILIGVFLIQGTYNKIVSSDEAIDANWAQVENVLQRRYDLIPNLVNTVKGFADHEKEVLTEVTRLRSQWGEAKSVQDKAKAASLLESALGRLMVVVENYPNVKADQSFIRLQDELAGTENRVAVERRRYNEAVQFYNTTIRKFPGAFIANYAGFEKRDVYFEATEAATEAPVVNFD